jgi:hypothetical protein
MDGGSHSGCLEEGPDEVEWESARSRAHVSSPFSFSLVCRPVPANKLSSSFGYAWRDILTLPQRFLDSIKKKKQGEVVHMIVVVVSCTEPRVPVMVKSKKKAMSIVGFH